MGRDVRGHLILTNGAILAAGLLLLGAAFSFLLTSRVTQAHRDDLRYEASSLATQLGAALQANQSQRAIQRMMERDSKLIGKRILLLDRNGVPRYDSSRWTPFSRGSWRLVDLGALRRGLSVQIGSDRQIGIEVPVQVQGQVVGAVALVMAPSDIAVPWPQLLPALLIIVGLVLASGVLIGTYQIRSLIRPLRQVSEALRHVQEGRYDRPIPEEGWSEARELARRYNEMVSEVARSHQLLRDFMANAAHELKTPVALIAGFSRSLTDGTASREGAVTDAVTYIRDESEHLSHVVDQLFSLASLDANADALYPRECDPAALLIAVLERFQPRAATEGKRLWWHPVSDLPACTWDTDSIVSALGNLISNALDHTQSGDAVWAHIEVEGETCCYRIGDNGSGIRAEDIPHIFDRFYRGRDSRRQEGHAGLGLAIVREIIERHGGSVRVESTYGVSTEFILTLPLHVQSSAQSPLLEEAR